jgi:hypothetical protein
MNYHEISPKDKFAPVDGDGKNPETTHQESPKDNQIDYRQLYEQAKEHEGMLMQSLNKFETMIDEVAKNKK